MNNRSNGAALVTTLVLMFICMSLGAVLLQIATAGCRTAGAQEKSARTLFLAESGLQVHTMALWKDFKTTQTFTAWDSSLVGAAVNTPKDARGAAVDGNDRYSVAVIGYTKLSSFIARIRFRSVGWQDTDGDGVLDSNEPRTTVDEVVDYALSQAGVFDHSYYVNNYGWMSGFNSSSLKMIGDVRANGDFMFSNGYSSDVGLVDGSITAVANNKIMNNNGTWGVGGSITGLPSHHSNSSYVNSQQSRWRQGYTSSVYGTKGSSIYEQWRDLLYDADASIVNGRIGGAVLADVNGTRTLSGTKLDPRPTSPLIMPDLESMSYYQNLSQNYVDSKQTYLDGTSNTNYGQGAYVKVYNTTTKQYDTKSINGVVSGSLSLSSYSVTNKRVTTTYPVLIHGPITVLGDVVIRGVVSGQGTIYAQRNVHIVGDVLYNNPPVFTGTNPTTIEQTNEKKDLLGLAARGSIWLGNVNDSSWLRSVQQYIKPPFTKDRLDENGNVISAYNGVTYDSTGTIKYKSITTIPTDATSPAEIDAILYTNNVIGGVAGSNFTVNGSYICKDEATIVGGGTTQFIYDQRIKDRGPGTDLVVNINLPRAPIRTVQTWQVMSVVAN